MDNIDFNILKNEYNFKLNDLIKVGGRLNNPKRNFLFISKILGKHLLVKPNVCKATGYLLANSVYNENNFDINLLKDIIIDENKSSADNEFDKYINAKENVLVIGFAETATALGMSVACAIKDSYYITTTRENIKSVKSFFNFEEEHSHATSHMCYLKDLDKVKKADRIILVDDEITTGNTMLNLIKEFNKIYPNKKYTVLSILDFRNKCYYDNYEKFKKEYSLDIDVKSILSANIENTSNDILTGDKENLATKTNEIMLINEFPKETYVKADDRNREYVSLSGRFGVSFNEIRYIEKYAKIVADKINESLNKEDKICVIGHGEDIYIPSRIANYVIGDVKFKTTSRSPIFVKEDDEYPINERTSFELDGVKYFFYNKSLIEKEYDKVFVISEFDIKHKLTKNCINIKI